ncbi:MAG: hypothetical protein AB9846_00375 [Tenuifilaceae bacterium]
MKTKILIFAALSLLIFSNASNKETLANSKYNSDDSVRVYSSPELYNLAFTWVKEYSTSNPGAKIKVNKLAYNQAANIQPTDGNIYFLSTEYLNLINNKSILSIVIGMDAIIPIINSKNPFVEELNMQGLSREEIAKILTDPENHNLGTILSTSKRLNLKYYSVKNELIESEIADFLKTDKTKLNGTNVENEEQLISSIQNDPNAIGFCKLANIVDNKNENLVQGIKLLPIDKNNNGKIDYNENIYGDLNTLMRGVWIGKYPRELCGNIFSVSSERTKNESETNFLAWVLTNGQEFLNTNGYSQLAQNQRQANLDKLYIQEEVVETSNNRYAVLIALAILATVIAIFFVVDYTIQRLRLSKINTTEPILTTSTYFNEKTVVIPEGLYFDKSHTWAFMEKDGTVGIGIDDFLQHVTGPITKIKMVEPGEKVKKGEPFLTLIQEGKQLIIKAPLSGTVKAQNKNLNSNSSLINQSPYNEGWVYKIEPTNWLRDTQFLIFAQGYKEWLKMEFLHLKDFLAVALRESNKEKTQLVLQDGGEIRHGILKDLRPEIWEDFQTHFLDSPK